MVGERRSGNGVGGCWQDSTRASLNLIISPVAHKPSLQRMGLETERITNVGTFTNGQRQFLEFHRNAILLRVAR